MDDIEMEDFGFSQGAIDQLFAEVAGFPEINIEDLDLPMDLSPQVGFGAAPFEIVRDVTREYPRFRCHGREIELSINTESSLYDFCIQFLDMLLSECAPTDMVALTMFSPAHPDIPAIEFPFRRASDVTPEVVLNHFERICISKGWERLLGGGLLHFVFFRAQLPNGGAGDRRGKRNIANRKEFAAKWQSIVQIRNEDNMCLPRAIVTAIGRHLHVTRPDDQTLTLEYNYLRNGRKLQEDRARKLMLDAAVTMEPGDMAALAKYQAVLPSYRIIIFESLPSVNCIFKGPEGGIHLYLHYDDNHFDVIAKPAAAFGMHHFCEQCLKPFNHKDQHQCGSICRNCHGPSTKCIGDDIKCDECLRNFSGPSCFARHISGEPLCHKLFLCKHCFKLIDMGKRSDPHVCGETYCQLCRHYFPPGHLCYMQAARPMKVANERKRQRKAPEYIFVFYDLETIQVKPHPTAGLNVKEHQPILCISHTVCGTCLQDPSPNFTCCDCGVREHIFESEDPVLEFLDYVQTLNDCKNIVCVAHNSKGFDGQFILKKCLEVKKWVPEVILQGSKVLTLEYQNLKFVDSISFIPVGLAKFNSTFGLKNLVKGYFPHLFCNVVDHEIVPGKLAETNYVMESGMPPVKCYDPDHMFEAERNNFLQWYGERNGFNFYEELVAYCRNDVHILRLGCLQFREQFILTGEVDPLRECITIASACNLLFRRKFLKPKCIGLLPSGGYRAADKQSAVAIQWLEWEAHHRGIHIQHAKNGREQKVLNMKVDGLCDKLVFEFQGCWTHGCPTCFKDRQRAFVTSPGDNSDSRYQSTVAKTQRLRDAGFTVVEKWEHDFRRNCQMDFQLRDFIASRTWSDSPLDPRDAFFGGRTNAIQLYHQVSEGEKIHYLDVCSLYPYVNKYAQYPTGHPNIYLDNFPSLTEMEGLIKCTIVPPNDLYHPVLPFRHQGKLLFPLCRTCAESRLQDSCPHTDEERALTGTWVVDEVKKAVSLGYVISKVYELWQYEMVRYNPASGTGGLFTTYINHFVKVKQESSGWPSWCVTEEDRSKYITEYQRREGVTLDPDSIEVNPGLRSLAKLCLNSFWGKLGQRSSMPKCQFLDEPADFFALLTDPNIEVSTILPINDDIMGVKYKNHQEIDITLPHTNVPSKHCGEGPVPSKVLDLRKPPELHRACTQPADDGKVLDAGDDTLMAGRYLSISCWPRAAQTDGWPTTPQLLSRIVPGCNARSQRIKFERLAQLSGVVWFACYKICFVKFFLYLCRVSNAVDYNVSVRV